MLFLTDEAIIVCKHELGRIQNKPSQLWVTIDKRTVLVENDPENKSIKGCPNYGVGIKPCQQTLKVKTGYSEFIRIGGRRVTLDSLAGLTDGTPPGLVKYKVDDAGQKFVRQKDK